MSRGKEYEEHVERINALKEKLKKDSHNNSIREEIQMEEDNMFRFIISSTKELEIFIRENKNYDTEEEY